MAEIHSLFWSHNEYKIILKLLGYSNVDTFYDKLYSRFVFGFDSPVCVLKVSSYGMVLKKDDVTEWGKRVGENLFLGCYQNTNLDGLLNDSFLCFFTRFPVKACAFKRLMKTFVDKKRVVFNIRAYHQCDSCKLYGRSEPACWKPLVAETD